MGTTEDAELPVRGEPLAGPAIDQWRSRREDNNNEKFSAEKMKQNYETVRSELLNGLRELIHT